MGDGNSICPYSLESDGLSMLLYGGSRCSPMLTLSTIAAAGSQTDDRMKRDKAGDAHGKTSATLLGAEANTDYRTSERHCSPET